LVICERVVRYPGHGASETEGLRMRLVPAHVVAAH
jgi:hypothetical protein